MDDSWMFCWNVFSHKNKLDNAWIILNTLATGLHARCVKYAMHFSNLDLWLHTCKTLDIYKNYMVYILIYLSAYFLTHLKTRTTNLCSLYASLKWLECYYCILVSRLVECLSIGWIHSYSCSKIVTHGLGINTHSCILLICLSVCLSVYLSILI